MKYVLLIFIAIAGCKTHQKGSNAGTTFQPDFTKGPPAIVYKTRKNYTQNVPVILSEDQTRIVAYPGIEDINLKEGLPVPTSLQKHYLLDHRGINKNVAFLSLTYEQYANLDTLPTLKEMYALIIDKDPLVELCDCGSQKAFTDLYGQLNQLIANRQMRKICRVVK